jgi:regulation of enolase protein 1 (concanavalin A-like superfamily)
VVGTTASGASIQDQSDAFQIVLSATSPNGLPPGWSCGDVGAVGAAGSCAYEVDDELWPDFVVNGSGADIWGTADEFSYAGYAAYGDFSITARVLFVQNVNRWTKAGIMIRDWNGQGTPPADSRHASFFVTPTTEKGTAFQRRPEAGGASVHTAGPVATAPVWVKLIRTGDTIRAYHRIDPLGPWSLLGEQVFSGLPYQLSAMLVVSSHVDGAIATARFDNVVVDEQEAMQSADVGAAAAGSTATNGPEITIAGNGADIWGTADAFRFHYTPWRGDGFAIVRVQSLEQTHAWSKAGVMFRETLAPGSKQVMAIVSGYRGLAMQSRAQTDGLSTQIGSAPGSAPVWLMLRRFGSQFTSSWSTDGETWMFLGEVTIPMNAEVFVGLPVTSHVSGRLATAVFDDFSVRPVLR